MNLSLDILEQWLAERMGNAAWVDMASRLGAVLLVSLIIWLMWKLLDRWRKGVHRWIDAGGSGARALTFQDQQIFTERELARTLHSTVSYFWLFLRVLLFFGWLNLVFKQFAWTQVLPSALSPLSRNSFR